MIEQTPIQLLVNQIAVLWPTLSFEERVMWARAVTHVGGHAESEWFRIGLPMIQAALNNEEALIKYGNGVDTIPSRVTE